MPIVFDLREFALERYGRIASMRWLMGGLGVLWTGLIGWFLTVEHSISSLDLTQYVVFLVVYVGLGFALALSVWAVWMGRLGPVSLVILDRGIQFQMNSGRLDLLRWADISKGVALVDYSASPYLAKVSRTLWQLRRWNRPPTELTKEAFDAIIASAGARGLGVTSSMPRNSRWGPCRVVRFSVGAAS
jgi:hypothetical protein